MSKKFLVIMAVVFSFLFVSAGLYAGTSVDDVVKMNDPIYKKHKKGICEFTHKKHSEDYKIDCGECHHDAKGKALTLKMGDEVQKCSECHKETKKPKGEKLSKKEKIIKYQKEALHANCITCHKKEKKGPKKCAECHPKKKK